MGRGICAEQEVTDFFYVDMSVASAPFAWYAGGRIYTISDRSATSLPYLAR
jgi:hypothetical protein